MSFKVTVLEIFLFQLVVWLGIWLANDYMATLLTLIVVAIVLAVLLIALISERLDRSKVSKTYFQVMALSAAAPLLAALVYVLLFGELTWFTQQ
jgi:hypothetical protein